MARAFAWVAVIALCVLLLLSGWIIVGPYYLKSYNSAGGGTILTVGTCLHRYARQHPTEGYPSSLADLGRGRLDCMVDDFVCPQTSCEIKRIHYNITYRVSSDRKHYVVSMRPMSYGRTDTSFVMTDDAGIYMTHENRAASLNDDKIADPSEIGKDDHD